MTMRMVIKMEKNYAISEIPSAYLFNLFLIFPFTIIASFPGFASIPTSNNQTILIGNIVGNQPNIIPAQSVTSVTTSKAQELQKVIIMSE